MADKKKTAAQIKREEKNAEVPEGEVTNGGAK